MVSLMGGVMKIDLNKILSCDRTIPQTEVSLRARRHIAEKLLGPICWGSEVVGLAKCPGECLRTTRTNPKDCRVTIDNVPTILAERFLASDITDITSLSKEVQETYRNYYNEAVRKRRHGGGQRLLKNLKRCWLKSFKAYHGAKMDVF